MPDKKPKLVVIDGNAIIHRAWHALPQTLRTGKGELVNAVYGFTSILLRVLKELKPAYVAVTFDHKGPTFRHKDFPAYKAQRVKKPQEFYDQFDRIRQVVRAFNIPTFELAGYEADDLIGTIVASPAAAGVSRLIVTGDMDTLQLVDHDVSVFALHAGISEAITYTPTGVRERFGLSPAQLVDFKALRGDPSDNIPGVKGIGEKTATQLLQDFDTLEGVYRHLASEKIPERVRKLLAEHRKEAQQAKELVQIVRDAPIKFSLADCALADYDPAAVAELFRELEFKSLMSRLPKPLPPTGGGQGALALGATPAGRPRLNSPHYQLVDTEEKFEALLAELKQQPTFAVDTETSSLDALTAKLVGISVSWQAGHAAFILPKPKWLTRLKTVLENPAIGKAGHNLKFDLHSLATAGVHLRGIAFDTMVASYLLNPGSRAHGLDALAFSEFGVQMTPISDLIGKGAKQISMADVPLDDVVPYACADADYTARLVAPLRRSLEQQQQLGLLEKIELPLIEVLASMERAGVKLDVALLTTMSGKLAKQLAELEAAIHAKAGGPFNINSPLQLKEVLFGKLGISALGMGRTKTGISTAADELEKLAGTHAIIPLILQYRELSKLKSTYLDTLPQLVAGDGRVHTSYHQTVAATGRLSSSDPNLQNIPIRTPVGAAIRTAFIAERGARILSADYNQIELRVIASLAEDPTMIETFRRGEDIHTRTASELHDVPVENVDKALRRTAKEVNFGIIYGMGASGLAQRQGIPRDKAKAFIDKYFALHPKIAQYLETTKQLALQHGYVETIFGRRRYLPEIASSAPQIRSAAERAAINHPIQGCLPAHVKILTSRGYLPIGELYRSTRRPSRIWDGSGWKSFTVLNRGQAQLAQITFSHGQILDCDVRHQILTVDDRGYRWKKFTELIPGDRACFTFPQTIEFPESKPLAAFGYARNRQSFSIQTVDAEFWHWLGYYYGDGHATKRYTTRATRYDFIYTFGSHQRVRVDQCRAYFRGLGLNPRLRKIPPSTPRATYKWSVEITSIGFGKFLEHLGVTMNEDARTKRLPPRVYQESVANRTAFITGFFAADGAMGKTNAYLPNFHLCQREILQELQLLLRSLGVESYLRGPYRYRARVSYRLDILRNSFEKLLQGTATKLSRRNNCTAPKFLIDEILQRYPRLEKKFFAGYSDYIIYRRWKTGGTSTVHHVVEWLRRSHLTIPSPIYVWHAVTATSKAEVWETTYTLSVDGTHRFDSEGVISKNTAADLMKLAMIAVHKQLPAVSPKSRMIMQVHDELVFEVPTDDVAKVATFVKQTMEGVYQLRVPILVHVGVGGNWGALQPVGA